MKTNNWTKLVPR